MISQKMLAEVRKALEPLDHWHHHCHGASVAVVNAELFTCRVARGWCDGVDGQHSWVVTGKDCYDVDAEIIDPTLWSYDPEIKGVYLTTNMNARYKPHGQGSIWDWGKPEAAAEEPIQLDPGDKPFSDQAKLFLDMLGPLDRKGWATLAHAPVEEWPAAEILPAINRTVGPLVPIDIIGMITNENPGELYLARGHEDEFAPVPFARGTAPR